MKFLLLFIVLYVAPLQARESILVLGDSLSAAHNMTPESGWVSLLAASLDERGCPADIVNASISGETTIGGLTRLPKLIEMNNPSIVIVELGANDGLRGFPVGVLRSNLQQIIDLAHNANAQVLLLGMRIPSNYGHRYSSAFADTFQAIADENNVHFLPFFLAGISEDENLMQADTIHPNERAQPLLLAMVQEALINAELCRN